MRKDTVTTDKLSQNSVEVKDFSIALKGQALVAEGESLLKLIKSQLSTLIFKSTGVGKALNVIDLRIEDVKELGASRNISIHHKASTSSPPEHIVHHGMSEEGRNNIRKAMKKRWRKFFRMKKTSHEELHGMSVAGRKRISQMMKDRWAEVHKNNGKALGPVLSVA